MHKENFSLYIYIYKHIFVKGVDHVLRTIRNYIYI